MLKNVFSEKRFAHDIGRRFFRSLNHRRRKEYDRQRQAACQWLPPKSMKDPHELLLS